MELLLVDFEQAKMLKEAGFDWPTYKLYMFKTKALKNFTETIGVLKNHNATGAQWISCPTVALALQWLREERRVHVYVKMRPTVAGLYYCFFIQQFIAGAITEIQGDGITESGTFAESDGLTKALELLTNK